MTLPQSVQNKPCQDFKDNTIIAAFEEVFNKLKTKHYTPAITVTDNQATAQIIAFLRTHGCKWRFVEPLAHCVNGAEQAI